MVLKGAPHIKLGRAAKGLVQVFDSPTVSAPLDGCETLTSARLRAFRFTIGGEQIKLGCLDGPRIRSPQTTRSKYIRKKQFWARRVAILEVSTPTLGRLILLPLAPERHCHDAHRIEGGWKAILDAKMNRS